LVAQTEVYDFQRLVLVEEKVFRFEVAMYDTVFVYILDSCEKLLHEEDGFGLVESFFFDDVIEEFSSFSVLHDEVDVSFGFDDLCERGVLRRVG
jgi:hypothetical protein